ncbi:MAG: hypothetical protein Greene101415_53, partial [Parcubacteria group bacterium Greene1014_15]
LRIRILSFFLLRNRYSLSYEKITDARLVRPSDGARLNQPKEAIAVCPDCAWLSKDMLSTTRHDCIRIHLMVDDFEKKTTEVRVLLARRETATLLFLGKVLKHKVRMSPIRKHLKLYPEIGFEVSFEGTRKRTSVRNTAADHGVLSFVESAASNDECSLDGAILPHAHRHAIGARKWCHFGDERVSFWIHRHTLFVDEIFARKQFF